MMADKIMGEKSKEDELDQAIVSAAGLKLANIIMETDLRPEITVSSVLQDLVDEIKVGDLMDLVEMESAVSPENVPEAAKIRIEAVKKRVMVAVLTAYGVGLINMLSMAEAHGLSKDAVRKISDDIFRSA